MSIKALETEKSLRSFDRLAQLERRVDRLRRTLSMLLLLCGVSLLVGFARPRAKTVTAQTFMLRDKNGNARGKFYMSDQGPRLAITDARGKPRIILGLLKEREPHLSLADADGRVRARLSLEMGVPHLVLRDRERKDRAIFATHADGSGRLQFFDSEKTSNALLSNVGGASLLDLGSESGGHAVLRVERGAPKLILTNADGETVFSKP